MIALIRTLIQTKREIIRELRQLQLEVKTMADVLADLNAAVTSLTDAVTAAGDQIKAETATILAALANPPVTGIDPAAVEAAAQNITALASGLHDAVAAAQGALNPAPTV